MDYAKKALEDLKKLVGTETGVSDWMEVSQERINQFADATGDHQWIHVDVERAKRESPMGGPIAHGFLTLSLLPALRTGGPRVEGVKAGINYGLNKVRFISPVPAGGRVRARTTLKSVEEHSPGRILMCNVAVIELEGSEKPACIAETLSMLVF